MEKNWNFFNNMPCKPVQFVNVIKVLHNITEVNWLEVKKI